MSRRALPLTVFLVGCASALPQEDAAPYDLVVHGATLVDGTGAPARRADLAVRAGRIAAVGDLAEAAARERLTLPAHFVVAPGFVDVHLHADQVAARLAAAENLVRMGVTTIVTGNCGSSVLPLAPHLERLERRGIGVNYASLVGHGTVRTQVLGLVARAPDADELRRMAELVAEALRDGAFGMSTGLIYVPGTYAETEELIALAKVVGRHDGVYASHMRDEGARVLASIEEALRIGREGGCRVQLSHLKASGKPNWGRGEAIVERIARARDEGFAVCGDQYAYTASSTSLDVLFPTAELEVGRERFSARVREDAAFRERMALALREGLARSGFADLDYARIAHAPGHPELTGRTLRDAAHEHFGSAALDDQIALALRLVADSRGRRIGMIYHKMDEPDVRAILAAPFVAVASDGGIQDPLASSHPHPRSFGNNPRVLARYVRDWGVLPLELAVHKMTALPAEHFRLVDRGTLRVGAHADVVVLDPEAVEDRATFQEPRLAPHGILHVFVNGEAVVRDGEPTGALPGHVLRHGR